MGCKSSVFDTIVIRGSDTEVNLVLKLAEEYMEIDSLVSIAVTGGGSGTGIAALINRKTDIANSSRSFKDSEIKLAIERGVQVTPIIFAVDALSFIVEESLPIDRMSLDEIRGIFKGEITNWSEVGGPDLDISLYGRQGNSGTFVYIQRDILKGDYSSQMKQMNGSSQIVESVKNDQSGIGYVGIGYVTDSLQQVTHGIKVLTIEDNENQSISSPLNTEDILEGRYPVVRPLYQYTDGYPSGKVKSFIEYELSPTGQDIIKNNGYFPITSKHRNQNAQYLR
jgi:phosphate transport system substrate-binding protein